MRSHHTGLVFFISNVLPFWGLSWPELQRYGEIQTDLSVTALLKSPLDSPNPPLPAPSILHSQGLLPRKEGQPLH